MQVPKRKTSKSKRNMRRSHHALSARQLAKCNSCGEPVLPHHICMACGSYRERQILNVAAE